MSSLLAWLLKEADHAEDRFKERLSHLPPEVLQRARDAAKEIPAGPEDRLHAPLHYQGRPVGFAAFKRVGKNRKPVLATILGPQMLPRNSHELAPVTTDLVKAAEVSPEARALVEELSNPELPDERRREILRKIPSLSLEDQGALAMVDSIAQRARARISTPEAAEAHYRKSFEGGARPKNYTMDPGIAGGEFRIPGLPSEGTYGAGSIPREEEPPHIKKYLDLLEKDLGAMTPEQQRQFVNTPSIGSRDMSGGALLSALREGLDPEGHRQERATYAPERKELQALFDQLPLAKPEERATLINSIIAKDRDLHRKAMAAHGKGLLGLGPGGTLKAKGLALGAGAMLTSNFWTPVLMRQGLRYNLLSPEERKLPNDEQDKLLSKRSPVYRQLLEQDSDAEIRAKDVLAPVGMGLNVAQLSFLDKMTGSRASDTLDPRQALSELVGAQIFHHGTSPKAVEGIKARGIDPGFGGTPEGFTWKATQREALSSLEGVQSSLRAKAMAKMLGADGFYDLQPSVYLPGADARLQLGTEKFLHNAYGNLFITKSRAAAKNYAASQNPKDITDTVGRLTDAQGKILSSLYDTGDDVPKALHLAALESGLGYRDADMRKYVLEKIPDELLPKGYTRDQLVKMSPAESKKLLPNKKLYRLLTDGKARGAAIDTLVDMKHLMGDHGLDKKNPNVFTGVMPVEEFEAKFMPDLDDVNQGGTAVTLKPEFRTKSYGKEGPPPGKPQHYHIAPETLEQGLDASYANIFKARAKDLGKYIRGEGLPDSERVLGMNRRFATGAARTGAIGAVGALGAYGAFAPIAKKLLRDKKPPVEEAQEGNPQEPKLAFALPGDRFPIHDEKVARASMIYAAAYASPEEQLQVHAAIQERFPNGV